MIDAAFAYDDACRELHGEFAHPNFTEAEQFAHLVNRVQIVIDSKSVFVQRVQLVHLVGVRKVGARFVAKIRVDGKMIHLGTFDSQELAGQAYDAATLKYRGSGAKLNYPNEVTL